MNDENNNQEAARANKRLDQFNAGPTIPLSVDLAWQSRGFIKTQFFVAGIGEIASNGRYELTIPGAGQNAVAMITPYPGGDATGQMIPAISTQNFGSATTQFDITNTAGDTYRYTYDGTGTNPNISSATMPAGSRVQIFGTNFNVLNQNAASRPYFTVTNSGNNFFEVENSVGVAENNVTIGTGSIIGGPSSSFALYVEGTATTQFSFVVFLFEEHAANGPVQGQVFRE